MIQIRVRAPDQSKPFENLLPIVADLEANGNMPTDGGFILNPDGWRCRMTLPLDFDQIAITFEVPANVELSRGYDTVLDKLTWRSIEGPRASGR